MTKKISVIIPHHPIAERKQLLIRSLKALLLQSIPKSQYEIIVVIDGFSDNLVEFLNKYFEEIIVLTKKHTGVCQTRNLGIEYSKANYIAFVDDDCIPDEKWLENFLNFISKKPDTYAIGGQTLSLSNESIFQRYAIKRMLLAKPVYLNGEIISLITANAVVKLEILNNIGAFEREFDTIFGSCGGEDADLSFKLRREKIELSYCESAIVYHFHRKTLRSFIKQQYRNGQGLIIHTNYRNISIKELGFPEPKLLKIFLHMLQYIFINKDGSPSVLKRTKSYFFDSDLSLRDKLSFPLIDILRRGCYYTGIYFGNRKFRKYDTTNL